MKNRVLVAGMLVFVMAFSMFGCSLAVPEPGEEVVDKDQLIGVFITTENLSGMDEKVYATIDKHDSTEPADWDIYFEGLVGEKFFNATFQMEDDDGVFRMNVTENTLCDIGTQYCSYDDESTSIELSGTLYVRSNDESIYYMNPVYQTSTGEIYVINGGMGDSVRGLSDGVELTSSINEKYATTENGKTVTEEMTVNVNFKVGYKALEILIHQMGADNQVIKTTAYEPGTVPEQLTMEKDTAYVIVETKLDNPEDSSDCIREVYDRQEERTYFETFFVTDNGGLSKQGTEIMWQ